MISKKNVLYILHGSMVRQKGIGVCQQAGTITHDYK